MDAHISPDHALVLVVEDNPVARLVLVQQLQRWGFAVAEAADGETALAMLGEPGGPRIVLLDWMLPGIAGTEVCLRVRASPILPQPHIIMLTSRDELDDVVTGLRAGADDYVVKPPVPAELQARLAVAVRVTRLQGELAARVRELEAEKAHVRELREILPICSVCRKIRDDAGAYEQIETYFLQHRNIAFSHGYCPACAEEAMREVETLTPQRGPATRPTP